MPRDPFHEQVYLASKKSPKRTIHPGFKATPRQITGGVSHISPTRRISQEAMPMTPYHKSAEQRMDKSLGEFIYGRV
jgi:hypothetical protein